VEETRGDSLNKKKGDKTTMNEKAIKENQYESSGLLLEKSLKKGNIRELHISSEVIGGVPRS